MEDSKKEEIRSLIIDVFLRMKDSGSDLTYSVLYENVMHEVYKRYVFATEKNIHIWRQVYEDINDGTLLVSPEIQFLNKTRNIMLKNETR